WPPPRSYPAGRGRMAPARRSPGSGAPPGGPGHQGWNAVVASAPTPRPPRLSAGGPSTGHRTGPLPHPSTDIGEDLVDLGPAGQAPLARISPPGQPVPRPLPAPARRPPADRAHLLQLGHHLLDHLPGQLLDEALLELVDLLGLQDEVLGQRLERAELVVVLD